MQEKLLKLLKTCSNLIILILLILLISSMLLGTGHLIVLFYQAIASPDPYYFLINIEDLHIVFSILLIMLVGHELFKSIILLLNHENIPVKSILKIAAIAMANKVITLDIKHMNESMLLGLSAILLSIGIAFFFFNKEKEA
ncbi:phosphate-starvation-inducible PsiE family protein [Sediminibacterium sp.]|uniref:phosphate-starvation-inducible PsiE family protein n=1 Tax=Sediminibacterium sp. TaxID=1917865 RepID=UPI002732C025|nr:phosphate-starvation-inducible PsiE family protein [Sediminibacterium sp.]MDP3394741.1 phosphate-starvation-inducible PsiE family protein [Sediminibacterium sp.]MDP3568576.1 phosphate-starvation-inducible PsiE family protein [Sediminibacterium sp.]